MEIHNNEITQKGGTRGGDESSGDAEIIEIETNEKSSEYSQVPDENKPFNMSEWLDTESFPASQNSMLASWRAFTQGFLGTDLKMSDDVKDICQNHEDKMVDLRPYMIENVYRCTRFDYLPIILQIFQHHHLRHLVVVNPINNRIEGVITRQDIFMYMPL
jgi:hypothetical protein